VESFPRIFFYRETHRIEGKVLAHGAIDRAEDDGHDDEPRVPVVLVVDRGDAEEHEYDGFRAARQHLHRILDGRMGLVGYIGFDVVLHGDAAERDPATKRSDVLRYIRGRYITKCRLIRGKWQRTRLDKANIGNSSSRLNRNLASDISPS